MEDNRRQNEGMRGKEKEVTIRGSEEKQRETKENERGVKWLEEEQEGGGKRSGKRSRKRLIRMTLVTPR